MEANLNDLKRYLNNRYLSPSSVKNYLCQVEMFLKHNPNIRFYDHRAHYNSLETFLLDKNPMTTAAIGHYYNMINLRKVFKRFKKKFRKRLMQKTRKLARKTIPAKKLLPAIYNMKSPYKEAFLIQYQSGSRISEILKIRFEDVWEEESKVFVKIKVLKTSADEFKTLELWPKNAQMLKEYIKSCGRKEGRIFNRQYGMFNKVIKEAFKEPEYNKKVSTHWIRSSRANHVLYMYKNDARGILIVNELLRHSRLDTTKVYLKESGLMSVRLTEDELKSGIIPREFIEVEDEN